MPKVRGKQIADGEITSTQADTATGTISTIDAGDGANGGTSAGLSNRDHQHAVNTGTPAAASVSAGAAAEGSGIELMRADASLQADVSGALDGLSVGQVSADGTGDGLALKTHSHAVPAAAATDITDSTNSAGSSGNFVHSDHQHAHGSRGGGTLHSAATTGTAGFMSALDKVKLDGLSDATGQDAKESCRIRAQGNLGLSGLAAIDGVTPVDGDRILVDQQTTGSEDGIYVAASGVWTRADDAATGGEARGWRVHIEEGTADADKLFQCTNNDGSDVVGTDGLTFAQVGSGSPRGAGAGLNLAGNDLEIVAADGSITVNAASIQVGVIDATQHGDQAIGDGLFHAAATGALNGFMSAADKTKLDGVTAGAEPNDTYNQESVASQVITGTDTAITDNLDNTPTAALDVKLFLNGVLQEPGAGNDYTISGTSITWLAGTGTAVDLDGSDILTAVYYS